MTLHLTLAEEVEMRHRYEEGGQSLRLVAKTLHISKDTVRRRLLALGVTLRTCARRPQRRCVARRSYH